MRSYPPLVRRPSISITAVAVVHHLVCVCVCVCVCVDVCVDDVRSVLAALWWFLSVCVPSLQCKIQKFPSPNNNNMILLHLFFLLFLLTLTTPTTTLALTTNCQAMMDTWCNDVQVPAVASCVESVVAIKASLPLYARFDGSSGNTTKEWRCYSGSSLSPDTSHYVSGGAYCSLQAQLLQVQALCSDPADFGVQVFPFNTNGVYMYRIPVVVAINTSSEHHLRMHHFHHKSATGTVLLAFAEARVYSGSDAGPKRIGMRRSYDNGVSWEEQIKFIVNDSTTDPHLDGLNLGAAVVDTRTQTIFLCYCEGAHTLKVAPSYIISSKDGGDTWSAPLDITKVLAAAGFDLFAGGPGSGVQLSSGRLVMAGWYRTGAPPTLTGSGVIYSDDAGATWQVGGRASRDGMVLPNEAQVALGPNDMLVLNMRDEQPSQACHHRLQAVSKDGGVSFTSNGTAVSELIDPVCQGSIISLWQDRSTMLVSNSHSCNGRVNGTIYISRDAGATYQLLSPVFSWSFAYSGLVQINATHVGVIFEAPGYVYGDDIKFKVYKLQQ